MAGRAFLVVVGAVLVLGACGSDADDASDATASPASSSSTEAPASASPSTAPSASSSTLTSTMTTAPTSAVATTAAPTTAAPMALEGREFVSTAVVGYELVPDTEILLTFDGDRIGAAGGCNQLGSTWSLDGDTLVVAEMTQTMMACEPPTLMDQDTWLSSFLTSDPTIALDGDTLTLTEGQSSITLVDRRVAQPDQPLEGPTWTLESIIDADSTSSVPIGDRPPTLAFAGGEVAVDTGCNTGSASYQATDTEITFSSLALTELACDEPVAGVEAAIVAVLDGVVSFTIDADQLTLTKGDQGLVYRSL